MYLIYLNLEWLKTIKQYDIKTKQPSSGVLYGNITSFKVVEGSPSPCGLRWSFLHPKLSDITTQITRLRLFCFMTMITISGILTVSCGEFFLAKILQKSSQGPTKVHFFHKKTSKWEKWLSWWLRMTNAFILCNLLWKVQKGLAANREGSFNHSHV